MTVRKVVYKVTTPKKLYLFPSLIKEQIAEEIKKNLKYKTEEWVHQSFILTDEQRDRINSEKIYRNPLLHDHVIVEYAVNECSLFEESTFFLYYRYRYHNKFKQFLNKVRNIFKIYDGYENFEDGGENITKNSLDEVYDELEKITNLKFVRLDSRKFEKDKMIFLERT